METEIDAKRQELASIRLAMMDCRSEIEQTQMDIGTLKGELARLDLEIPKLRTEWHKINDQRWDGDETCPTCGQPLPPDQIETSVANHNRRKAGQLEQITAKGQDLSEKRCDAKRAIERAESCWPS